ncbi:MAG TPA: ATP12 family protein [Xanthobacteraceae bacterium]|nr:ATP12 family protein [Xanthobacteraceae bacterium]
MRDIFADIFADEPANPMDAARRAMRPQLRRRFYQCAEVGEGRRGFDILLDGKPVRTPARRTLAVPNDRLAQAIAAEWEAQREVVDPATMPLTRLANSIIDGVTDAPAPVADEVANYLASDLILYRAQGPEGLRALQQQHWDPVLTWARDSFDARFILTEGVMPMAQPESALANARKSIPTDVWRLGALHSVTTLTGSALLALALLHGRLDVSTVWAAAHVDEDFQMAQWGRDHFMLERREFRFREMQAAATVIGHLKS